MLARLCPPNRRRFISQLCFLVPLNCAPSTEGRGGREGVAILPVQPFLVSSAFSHSTALGQCGGHWSGRWWWGGTVTSGDSETQRKGLEVPAQASERPQEESSRWRQVALGCHLGRRRVTGEVGQLSRMKFWGCYLEGHSSELFQIHRCVYCIVISSFKDTHTQISLKYYLRF